MKQLVKVWLFTFSMFILSASLTQASDELIATYEKDVTGDGKNEIIELHGIRFSPKSPYFQNIFAIINSGEDEWLIHYQGGYEPVLQFADLTHNGIADILYHSATGGSGGLYHTQLNTVREGKVETISLPTQQFLKGHFIDGFFAEVELTLSKEPIKINLEGKKQEYIELGIYNKEGKVIGRDSLMIDPIAFYEIIHISEANGSGLKSYQQISGAYHAEHLGTVESLWYYENEKWTLLQTEWESGN